MTIKNHRGLEVDNKHNGELFVFFIEPEKPDHVMCAVREGSLWLGDQPGREKVVAEYMRRVADRIEKGDWTVQRQTEAEADAEWEEYKIRAVASTAALLGTAPATS